MEKLWGSGEWMNDNSGIDFRDINMEIFNNFNQNKGKGESMNDKIVKKFEKEWRFHDGDNFPFGTKRLCILFWESRDEEVKQLENLIRDMLFDIPVIPERHKYVERLKEIDK